MIQIYSRYGFIGLVSGALFLVACNKQDKYPIPNVPVNITINLDLPSYQALNAPGGYAYVNGGSRGIVVYRNFDEFVALDRHSTYDSDNPDAIVHVNPDNVFELIDTLSDSRFSITNGGVLGGPAKFGLKRYSAYWDGAYTVNIYN
jgi:hypothetical protein